MLRLVKSLDVILLFCVVVTVNIMCGKSMSVESNPQSQPVTGLAETCPTCEKVVKFTSALSYGSCFCLFVRKILD